MLRGVAKKKKKIHQTVHLISVYIIAQWKKIKKMLLKNNIDCGQLVCTKATQRG